MSKPIDHQDLRNQISAFPRGPGVYLMKDDAGVVIYVGKAKNLRARVRTYFAGGDGRLQIEFLIKKVLSIEKIVTQTEQQAFALERDLITKHKPRYNVRLKDDKAYLSIRINESDPWPRLELVRRIENDGARYFGPYSFSYELKQLLEIVKRVVPLRTCTNTVFFNRQRPCLEYQIKRCAGPCCLAVDPAEYRSWVKQAIAILEGKTADLIKRLNDQMERASLELRFEDAAVIRDRLQILENFKEGKQLIISRGENQDVFALHREERLAALTVLKVRAGRVADGENFTFANLEVPTEEIVETAIGQFYDAGREIPDEIIVPFSWDNLSLVRGALREKRGASLEIIAPERGIKYRLLQLAKLNAQEHFRAHFDSETRYLEVAQSLAKLAELKQMPRRIECVDISNFQGSDIVGANVSFFDGQIDKAGYRKYKFPHQLKPDDFSSIYELIQRRLVRAKAEDSFPDLIVIDGGPGQLDAALRARTDVGAEVDIVSLAKMRTESDFKATEVNSTAERIFIEGRSDPIILDPAAEVTKFLQRVRDEAHRFVITFHRSSRAKRTLTSSLDKIPGVSPERRARLFRAFGSLNAMRSASPEDLARAGRMPKPLAEKILKALQNKN